MAEFKGLSQYCSPLNYDLQGRTFHLIMDDMDEILLYFTDGETLHTARRGECFITESCDVMKADDTTYFVHYVPEASKDLEHIVYILDTEQRLVTRIFVQEAFDPALPRLMKVVPSFGAIKEPGMRLPEKRHYLFSGEVGAHITWHYNPAKGVTHIYHTPTSVRTGTRGDIAVLLKKELESDDPSVREKAEETVRHFREREQWYPIYEEPAFHIRINDHLQVFSFVEENQVLYSPGHTHGGGGMIVVQDEEKLVEVGLCFNPADLRYSFTHLLTAYGVKDEKEDPNDTAPSPFDSSLHKCMPSNHWPLPEDK